MAGVDGWRSAHNGGSSEWHARISLGRIEVGCRHDIKSRFYVIRRWHIYRHTYHGGGDRWVFHPFLIFDRKLAA